MLEEENNKIYFILPFSEMVSSYVRALTLKKYSPNGWEFIYLRGKYPRLLNFYPARFFYRVFFFLVKLILMTRKNSNLYFISPQNPFILFLLKALKRNIIIDIHDAIHDKNLLGYRRSINLIKASNGQIFESIEYESFWKKKLNFVSSVIEDTPQNDNVYDNYVSRNKTMIWVGSHHTCSILMNYLSEIKLFYDSGYDIRLLGCSIEVRDFFLRNKIDVYSIIEYDRIKMIRELENAKVSFVPMPNDDLFKFRGNLKAKISMSYGCVTLASDIDMHKRLIENNKTGFLFSDSDEVVKIIKKLDNINLCSSISKAGSLYVNKKFSRKAHAEKVVEFISSF